MLPTVRSLQRNSYLVSAAKMVFSELPFLKDAKATVMKVNDLKNEEDHQLEMWHNALAEVEKKIDFIDQSLNEPEEF